MAEFDSRQLAAREATPPVKTAPYDGGRVHVAVATTPAAAAWAQNDTWNTGIKIPKGARILRTGKLDHAAFGASVTCDVGIRAASDGTVIDVDGIADGLNIAAAGVKDLNSGSLFVGGLAGGVMTQAVEVYVSLLSANPTDDAQAEIEIHWVGPQS